MHVNHRCRPQISPRDASTACATTSSLANAKMQSARSGTRRLPAAAVAVERVPPRKLLQRSKAAGEWQDGVRCIEETGAGFRPVEEVCFVPTAQKTPGCIMQRKKFHSFPFISFLHSSHNFLWCESNGFLLLRNLNTITPTQLFVCFCSVWL